MSAVLAPPEAPRLWSAEEAEAGRDEPPRLEAEPVAAALAVPEVQEVAAARGATLDDVVAGAWEALALGAPAACPCCGEGLRARWSAGSGLAGARCDACDARIE